MQTFLQIQEVATIEKKGAKYKEVVFKLKKTLGNRELMLNVSAKRCFLESDNEVVSNTDNCREDIFDAIDRFPIMDVTIRGTIETVPSTSYYIDEVEHTAIKVVCFEGENLIALAAKALQNYKALPLDECGNVVSEYVPSCLDLEDIEDDQITCNPTLTNVKELTPTIRDSNRKDAEEEPTTLSEYFQAILALIVIIYLGYVIITKALPILLTIFSTFVLFFVFAGFIVALAIVYKLFLDR